MYRLMLFAQTKYFIIVMHRLKNHIAHKQDGSQPDGVGVDKSRDIKYNILFG
jgi:hypothetical protein